MPSSNLAAYLAKNYLTASPASSDPNEPPKKKRKKTKVTPSSGLIIADDDEALSLSNTCNGLDDEENDTPQMYEGRIRSAEFRKAKKSAWQALSGNSAENEQRNEGGDGDDDDEADTLLRTAQSDEARRLAAQEAENAPAVVEMPDAPVMSGGMRAGLQTAEDTARMIAAEEAREDEERRMRRKKKKATAGAGAAEDETQEEQTIYRDATGRRIDVSLRRAEARREEAEKARAKQQEKIDAMGEVQLREREERKKDLDEAKFLTLGRSVEDEEYNERLKGQVRWDDPMAAYMAEKRAEEEEQVGGKKKGRRDEDDGVVRKPKKKEYQGAAPPNRYGVKPGWRWDGVDRGNGFEKEWFQARSRRSRNDQLSYEWQMDE